MNLLICPMCKKKWCQDYFVMLLIGISIAAFAIAFTLDAYKAEDRSSSILEAKPKMQSTMDNYSFSVGAWSVVRVLGVTNDHSDILHAARHFSQTNGWPPFNNREGFRGDE